MLLTKKPQLLLKKTNMQELFFITLIAIVAIVFGYTFSLERRTLKLEKKNGHEQHQIDQLKAENKELKELSFSLKKKVQELEEKLAKYERN